MEKVCFKCKRHLHRSEFYRHSQMADGLLGKCKGCAREDVKRHRALNLEKIRAYDKARSQLPHRKVKSADISRRWRQEDPRRQRAHNTARRKHRKAPGCCQMCGLEKRLERHHPDYDLPTLIVWLCKPCHCLADKVRRKNGK